MGELGSGGNIEAQREKFLPSAWARAPASRHPPEATVGWGLWRGHVGRPCGKPAVVCWSEVSSLGQLTKQQSVGSLLRLDGGMPRVPMSSDH